MRYNLGTMAKFPQLKIIVIDRDGVINQDSPNFIRSAADFHALPGSYAAIAKLNRAGYKVVVATNQSGIARGYFTMNELKNIHHKMLTELQAVGGHVDGIFICPHGPDANCDCRKPQAGLLREIATKFALTADAMLVIGDSIRDLQAAQNFGCAALLVTTGNGAKTAADLRNQLPTIVVLPDLAAAADYLLS